MEGFRRILLATDLSGASTPAFRTAVRLAKKDRAELVILHVVPGPTPVGIDGYVPPKMYEEMERSMRAFAEKKLERLVRRGVQERVRVRTFVSKGRAQDEIPAAARSKRCDLVVVGTHGRRGVARFFLGSVAAEVIATSPCPVLTVRPKK